MALDGTLAGLKTSFARLVNRDDLSDDDLNDFIKTAEAQMQRRFVGQMRQGLPYPRRMVTRNTSFAVTNAAETVAVPTDMAGPISFQLPNTPQSIELDYLEDVNFQATKAKAYWTGAPKYYTVVGSNFQLYPVADQAYTATLVYINRLPSIISAPNWVLTDYPDAYLYGMGLASAPFLFMEANREASYAQRFQAAVDDICNADPMPSDKLTLKSETAWLSRPWRAGVYDINTDS